MSLVDKMFEKRPKKNPVHTAIETLTKPEEITRFHKDYRAYMEAEGSDAETADQNIGYILGYYGEHTKKLWYGILDVNHPIFGPNFGRGE